MKPFHMHHGMNILKQSLFIIVAPLFQNRRRLFIIILKRSSVVPVAPRNKLTILTEKNLKTDF